MTQNKFKKIFVGGLPPQTTEIEMREYFSKYGDVCDVVAMRDKTGNKSRGFGFVVFKEAESVDRCQAERPHQLLGKIVDTKRAMPKEESVNPDIHCNSKRIFIGGLRRFFTEDDLKNYFKNFGPIVDCTIKRDSVSGASRGFAFITFTDRDIVDKVILSKPHSIRHCVVDVKKAMSPDELRHLDENHNHQGSNQSDYDGDIQKIYKVNSEKEDDSKEKTKKLTKRSQSYPQTDYHNYGYYMFPGDAIVSAASSPTPFPYDAQQQQHHPQQQPPMPLIWMSVQQCADGLILTPVATTDMYSPSYHPCYYSPNGYQQPAGNLGYIPQFFHGNGNGTVVGSTQPRTPGSTVADGTYDKSNGVDTTIDVSDLKQALPDSERPNDDDDEDNNQSADEYASEETAFGSPNSESV